MESNLILYTSNNGDVSIQVRYEDGTFWLSQKRMAELFGVNVRTINEHLKNLYETSELQEDRTIRKIRIVQKEGKRDVEREVTFYHLDAIIAVGYKVNSVEAVQFRKWATKTLNEFITKRYVDASETKQFFATVEDKLHWAISGKTTAEIIYQLLIRKNHILDWLYGNMRLMVR